MRTLGALKTGAAVVEMACLVAAYHLTVAWGVRRELRRWRARASLIPVAALRELAAAKLRDESLHSEAAAVFATTAPLRRRRDLVRLIVALEVMYDYLDAVSELAVPDPIAHGDALHRALSAALDPGIELGRPYAASPFPDGDGGYLADLVATCRAAFAGLPRADVVRPLARRAAARCGGGQTRSHAVAACGEAQLRAWSETLAPEGRGYRWWELAAGAAASLALHALLASAADPRTTAADARRIDAAYFPSVCALAALLDSLIDHEDDRRTGAHSFVGYYRGAAPAAERLGEIAADAVRSANGLRRPRRHAAIATGVAAFYLSADGARTPFAAPATARVLAAVGPGGLRPVLAIVAAKRRR